MTQKTYPERHTRYKKRVVEAGGKSITLLFKPEEWALICATMDAVGENSFKAFVMGLVRDRLAKHHRQ